LNFETKRQMRVLKRIVRGLRLSLQTMDLSDEDRLVVRKLLRIARAQAKESESKVTGSVNSLKPALTSSSCDANPVARQGPKQGSKSVGATQYKKKSRENEAHNQRASESPDEWKKPWNEVMERCCALMGQLIWNQTRKCELR